MSSWKCLHGLCQLEAWRARKVARDAVTGNRNHHVCVADFTIGPIKGKLKA
jgi:hypothetical protein